MGGNRDSGTGGDKQLVFYLSSENETAVANYYKLTLIYLKQ